MTNPISSLSPGKRVQSVDLLRGAVMVLMAIDHVRVYSGLPSGSPEPPLFFTRWVTHFCVPAFVFLAGTSAFLYGKKINDRRALSRFLLTRGLLLIVLELTLIRLFWTFNLNFGQFMLAGVIWMLGWCMVLMSVLVHLPFKVIWISGLLMIVIQQVFARVPYLLPESSRAHFSWIWEFIYSSGFDGPPGIAILYVVVPWVGVMMAGYGFGQLLMIEQAKKRVLCIRMGLAAIALFVVAGVLLIYFGPAYKGNMPFLFRLLGQQKYPPSQLYLLMTLGPLIALIPFAEKIKGWFAGVLITFGRVPFFYYILHILLIHLAALIVNIIRTGNPHEEWYSTAPFTELPDAGRWNLPVLYLVFVILEVILYLVCRQCAGYKASHPEKKWLKYI
ncbi:DUF1624 domain-containing protein [Mucilaginibacter sp. L3T2-6]|uniref:DUF1624 domain-containing protein n=1 Tax=Mucilaginibacter sp. L3T2-6 TaxID=3062491 RepID=UPI002675F82F|nr:heparan-alpha-glucosaminide N-acetyltransferase domain-containing protein [Mucilaginibacter sp. L3T2-6]MDO3644138.1 heparan-alpha-glucosaminide N-acetyltransferase domain-containing protein [Mucilaginibacter sp. L3T2-6]MDV6216581.1 heparan-alpha-glucosaminide N-acetyltransferase domain-containing protein [Mucilaginibacter sp. L3T2-6]